MVASGPSSNYDEADFNHGLLGHFEHPAAFFVEPALANLELSALTEAVAQYINPVIIRSAPLLPAPRNNFIDEHIFARIEAAGIEPAPFSSDTEFLRRVTLDLTGRIPSSDEVTDFIEDSSSSKRDVLIDSLIASSAFIDKWTMFFGDLFKLNGRASNVNRFTQGRDAFYLYLKESIAGNKPYDTMVKEIITATGGQPCRRRGEFPGWRHYSHGTRPGHLRWTGLTGRSYVSRNPGCRLFALS